MGDLTHSRSASSAVSWPAWGPFVLFVWGVTTLFLSTASPSATILVVEAVYVKYEKPRAYAMGEVVPILFNKLTSPQALATMSLDRLATCPFSTTTAASSSSQQQQQQQQDDPTTTTNTLEESASSSSSSAYSPPSSRWQRAINAFHGDFLQPGPPYELRMLEDVYCQPLCWMDLPGDHADDDYNADENDNNNGRVRQNETLNTEGGREGENNTDAGDSVDDDDETVQHNNNRWYDSIVRDMHFNLQIDGMPVAFRWEDSYQVSTRYWAGIPLGRRGASNDDDDNNPRYQNTTKTQVFLYNHWNIEIWYYPISNVVPASSASTTSSLSFVSSSSSSSFTAKNTYQVVRAIVEPFSIWHEFGVDDNNDNGTSSVGRGPEGVTLINPIASCVAGSTNHTSFAMLVDELAQPQGLERWSTTTTTATTTQPLSRAPGGGGDGFGGGFGTTNGAGAESTSSGGGGRGSRRVLFTYDVIWKPIYDQDTADKRWDIFLTMDDGLPLAFQLANVVLAVAINSVIYVFLVVWVMRDLRYRSIYYDDDDDRPMGNDKDETDDDDDQGDSLRILRKGNGMMIILNKRLKSKNPRAAAALVEMNLWPLSSQIFSPPQHARFVLCSLCGTGFHLFTTGLMFIVFFRIGIVNQSIGANILTPGVVFYTLTAWMGGCVTGRLCAIFEATWIETAWTTFLTALVFPTIAMILFHFVYDIFPDSLAPNYQAMSHGTPMVMIWLWVIVPSILAGGYLGFSLGPLPNFPVSSQWYQELNFQTQDGSIVGGGGGFGGNNVKDRADDDTSRSTTCSFSNQHIQQYWKQRRTPILFLFAGIPPILCCFVAFSYGIAGPVVLGLFCSSSLISIAPFVLFVTCAAGISALLYYRQIRVHQYQWWWSAFVSGSSCGFYIFILGLSWLFFKVSKGDVEGRTFVIFLFWFAFMSVAVGCMCGTAGVAACIILNRFLYVCTILELDNVSSLFRGDDENDDGSRSSINEGDLELSFRHNLSPLLQTKLPRLPEEIEDDISSRSSAGNSSHNNDSSSSSSFSCPYDEKAVVRSVSPLLTRVPPNTQFPHYFGEDDEEKCSKDGEFYENSEAGKMTDYNKNNNSCDSDDNADSAPLISRRLPLTTMLRNTSQLSTVRHRVAGEEEVSSFGSNSRSSRQEKQQDQDDVLGAELHSEDTDVFIDEDDIEEIMGIHRFQDASGSSNRDRLSIILPVEGPLPTGLPRREPPLPQPPPPREIRSAESGSKRTNGHDDSVVVQDEELAPWRLPPTAPVDADPRDYLSLRLFPSEVFHSRSGKWSSNKQKKHIPENQQREPLAKLVPEYQQREPLAKLEMADTDQAEWARSWLANARRMENRNCMESETDDSVDIRSVPHDRSSNRSSEQALTQRKVPRHPFESETEVHNFHTTLQEGQAGL